MVRRRPEEPGRFFSILGFWGIQARARQDAVLSGIPAEYTISKKNLLIFLIISDPFPDRPGYSDKF